jgi:DNA-binding response OmpR family regulator
MNTRFGAFEVDLEGRRLLKKGMPIALREQSFQVLAALIERPGEIPTREDLRRRLWAADVCRLRGGAEFRGEPIA